MGTTQYTITEYNITTADICDTIIFTIVLYLPGNAIPTV